MLQKGDRNRFNLGAEGRVPAAEVEWRVSNVLLYLVWRPWPWHWPPPPHCESGKNWSGPLCGEQQVAPVRPAIDIHEVDGLLNVWVCVYLYSGRKYQMSLSVSLAFACLVPLHCVELVCKKTQLKPNTG